MKKGTKILLVTLLILAYNTKAQQVIKKDTINGTVLSYTMDGQIEKAIDVLEEKCLTKKEIYNKNENAEKSIRKISIPNRALTNEEVCRQNPRISGYKIQVVVVKTNEEANKIRSDFRAKFPQLKVEVDASLRPNYKILVGSYFTKESAGADLKRIRKEFGTAMPVQYRIFCVEAK